MKVAIAQMNSTPGDFDAVVDKMCALARRAGELGSDLIVFPTPVLAGAEHRGFFDSVEFLVGFLDAIGRLADGLAIPAVVPVMLGAGNRSVCEIELLHDGRIERHGFDGSPAPGEEDGGEDGEPPVTFSFGGLRFGAAFDDADLDDFAHGASPVDVLLYLPLDGCNANREESFLAPSVSDGYYMGKAEDADAWLVAASAAGGFDELVFGGGSFVMAPWGELACVAPSFEEALVTADIDVRDEGPLEHPVPAPSYSRLSCLWEALVLGTRDFFVKEGIRDVGLVLEGDVCSSAVAALLVDALGPLRVHAVCATPPDRDAAADACQVARNLRIDFVQAPEASHELPDVGWKDLARSLLAAKAREGGWAQVSSADKTGLAIAPDEYAEPAVWAPLGDVYRSDVAGLARYRSSVSPVIPASALRRLCVPRLEGIGMDQASDELLLSTYDGILLCHLEQGMGANEVADKLGVPEATERVINRLNEREPSRRMMPSCPIVSDLALVERDWPCGMRLGVRVSTDWREERQEVAERVASQMVDEESGIPVGKAEPEEPVRDFPSYMRDLIEMGLMQTGTPDVGDGDDGDDDGGGMLFASGFFSDN